MTRSRLLVLSLFTALSVACASSSGSSDASEATADPIVGGKADAKDQAVVAVDIGGLGLCTGTLIGPRHVLTARHCVSETAEGVSCPATGPQIGANRDPQSLTILVGPDVSNATPVARGIKVFTPPGKVLCDHDIAVIELDRDVTSVKPVEVATKANLVHGTKVRAVGFGRVDDGSVAGKRFARGGIPVVAARSAEFETGEATCSGDSGGPAFDEATGKVVGVVSRGAMPCASTSTHNVFTRTDAFAALIETALASTGEQPGAGGKGGHAASGKACFGDTNCLPGETCSKSKHVCE